MKDALGHGSNAHDSGINQIGVAVDPRIKTSQSEPLPERFLHYTNNELPSISTQRERLIPNSVSLADPNSSSANFADPSDKFAFHGKNGFELTLKPGVKILKADVSDVFNFGSRFDNTMVRGKKLGEFAKSKGYDGVYIKNVPGAGNELALFDLRHIATRRKI